MKNFLFIFRHKAAKSSDSSEKIRSIFSKFQMILDMNTRIIEKMVVMERMSGGEYIFDNSFLESSVSEVSLMVYQVVYSLNAMTENRFAELFDTFQEIKGYLEDIVSGGPGPFASKLTLPYSGIRMEMQPLVGILSACLAELGHNIGVNTPDGFSITTTGVNLFLQSNDLIDKIGKIVADDPGSSDEKKEEDDLKSKRANPIEEIMRLKQLEQDHAEGGRASSKSLSGSSASYGSSVLSGSSSGASGPSGPSGSSGSFGKLSQKKRDLVRQLVTGADIPHKLETSIAKALITLSANGSKDDLFMATACTVGREDGESFASVYGVSLSNAADACRKCIAECIIKAFESSRAYDSSDNQMKDGMWPIAVALHTMIKPSVSGTISTLDPVHASQQLARVTVNFGNASAVQNEEEKTCNSSDGNCSEGSCSESSCSEEDRSESSLVQRFYPFDPVQSIIRAKKQEEKLPDKKGSLSVVSGGLQRGSALIRKKNLISLVESAMAAERLFGKPQKVHWAQDDKGAISIVGVEPLPDSSPTDVPVSELNRQIDGAEILMRGGETAQVGVAAGKVVHVSPGYNCDTFPIGAIAVAHKASPDLSPILRRAAGIITEAGSSIGHLATVAREVRIPAIVGAKDALEILKDGMVVTMDAGERKVYQGVLQLLVGYRASGVELYPTDPEYITLRQLLRWIIPLNMVDPDSQEFKSDNCRTLHDILHFAHEKAVEELLNIQSRHSELKGIATKQLKMDIPLDIRVLDISSSTSPSNGKNLQLGKGDIVSIPFRFFLKGISMEKMWDNSPASISMKDIFSGMDRTFSAFSTQPEYSGGNLAIIAENYFNLTLRLGYHFNVINAYLSEDQNRNFIYYRFVGGFAKSDRRRRRADFIASILEGIDFKIEIEGDLVIGKLKIADKNHMESALVKLGELTGFTRQLDVKMRSESEMKEYLKLFREQSLK